MTQQPTQSPVVVPRRRATRRFRVVGAGLALVLASACGSTLQDVSGTTATDPGLALSGSGDGSTGTTSGGLPAVGASSGQPGQDGSLGTSLPGPGGTTGTTGGTALPSGSTGGPSSTGGGPRGGSIPPTGQGWDSKHVYLGVVTQKDFQAAAASLGFSGIDPGDTQAQAQAVVDEINRKGGVYGRTVEIRTFDVKTIDSAQNPDPYAEQACNHFAQDAPVVAVVNIVLTLDTVNFRQCFARRHIPLINAGNGPVSRVDQKLAPYFFSLGTPSWDALAPVLVRRLKAQGYFTGWDPRTSRPSAAKPVVGVLVADTIAGHENEAAIVASLKAAGIADPVTYAYPPPGSDIDGAVLHFAQSGVTHVISNDIELVTFQIHAQNQRYAPRYGINTYNAPGLNLTQLGPPQQQIGEVGVGYAPGFDVVAANEPSRMGPGVPGCRALMKRANVRNSDRLADAFALLVCDAVRLAGEGMRRGGGLTGLAIASGTMAAGPSFGPAFAFRSGLSTRRQFLPAEVRDLAYVQSCTCFRYTSSTSYAM